MIDPNTFKSSLLMLLAEAFGATDNPHGWFLDDGKAGLLGTIEQIDVAMANGALRPENETVASHSGHLLCLLEYFVGFERGQQPKMDWPGSWRYRNLDAAAWDKLRADLRANYTTLTGLIQARTEWPEPAVGACMMLLAHVSYHVGEIKQILTSLKKD